MDPDDTDKPPPSLFFGAAVPNLAGAGQTPFVFDMSVLDEALDSEAGKGTNGLWMYGPSF